MNPLNAHLALELMHDHLERAERDRRARVARGPAAGPGFDAVTIRRSTAADRPALERLAQLEGRPAPPGPALVAEVEGRVVAAYWISSAATLADPFVRSAELVALLNARARHLGARPRLLSHPLRRAAAALRGRRAAHS